MNALPNEILLRIFNKLPHAALFYVREVSSQWFQLTELIWNHKKKLALEGNDIFCERNQNRLRHILLSVRTSLVQLQFVRVSFEAIDPFQIFSVSNSLRHLEFRFCFFSTKSVAKILEFGDNVTLDTLVWDRNILESDQGSRTATVATRKSAVTDMTASHLTEVKPDCSVKATILIFFAEKLRGLKELHLENLKIPGLHFVSMCENLGPSLKKLCFKERNCELLSKRFFQGLQLLTKLQELNVGGRCVTGRYVIDLFKNETLITLPNSCFAQLEILNLEGAKRLGPQGLSSLLLAAPSLRYLNLCSCELMNEKDLVTVLKNGPYARLLHVLIQNRILLKTADKVSMIPRFIDNNRYYQSNTEDN